MGVDDGALWERIGSLVVKTIVAVEAQMKGVWETFAAIIVPVDAYLKKEGIEPPPSARGWRSGRA